MACYARGDIGQEFATTYRLPTPKNAPFAIGYAFEGKPHDYLPDVVGTITNGKLFIAEAGMEDDKRQDRNLAKAEAARRLARTQRRVYWIGTERPCTRRMRVEPEQAEVRCWMSDRETPHGRSRKETHT